MVAARSPPPTRPGASTPGPCIRSGAHDAEPILWPGSHGLLYDATTTGRHAALRSVDSTPAALRHPGPPGALRSWPRPWSRRLAEPDPSAEGVAADVADLAESRLPGCATGWHTRCTPDQADDGDGELVERCCDGLLIARRRRPCGPGRGALMLATLVGLSHAAGRGRRDRHPGRLSCSPAGSAPARPTGIPSRPPPGSRPARPGGWPPSGPCSPRPSASATGISGPASTASRRLSSSLTTRA